MSLIFHWKWHFWNKRVIFVNLAGCLQQSVCACAPNSSTFACLFHHFCACVFEMIVNGSMIMSPLCEIRGRGRVIRLQWETEIHWITLTVFDWTLHVQPTYTALLHGNFLLQHLNVEIKGEKNYLSFSLAQFITVSELKCVSESDISPIKPDAVSK